jgi:hypothetical protein
MDQQQILNLPQGADAPFNQVLLRAPGVAEDSAANGDLHVAASTGTCSTASTTCSCPRA